MVGPTYEPGVPGLEVTVEFLRATAPILLAPSLLALSCAAPPDLPEDEGVGASHEALSLCGQFDTYNVNNKEYVVQQDEWGGNFGQCINANGPSFTVTSGSFNNSTAGAPATYPSIFKGCHWGNCTTN